MVPDFSGYVTKNGIKCSDGRVIMAHAFKGNDGQTVPLVWQHQHDAPNNVLGHVILHNRNEGVWGEGFFNDTPPGQQAKALVHAKDITALSIFANKLIQQAMNVVHGVICEVSLVLAGANPGAFIENVNLAHADGIKVVDDEAVIYTDEELSFAHAGSPSTTVPAPQKLNLSKSKMPVPTTTPPANKDGVSVQDVIDGLNPTQKEVVYALIGAAASGSDDSGQSGSNATHTQEGQGDVTHRNVFDQTSGDGNKPVKPGSTLSHSAVTEIFTTAKKVGSLKEAVESYALSHGIDNIETLFPYDQAVTDTPDWISRRMEWVAGVLNGTRKTPFSRIRSWTADITQEEARAKGYIKAGLKREEFFGVSRRITTPQTVYKKQKLDRDDILDITDFDVVVWLQAEMRVMLDEELARAVLVGDGRDIGDADKINPGNVRPIYGDDEMYVTNIEVDLRVAGGENQGESNADNIVDAVVMGMRHYRGSGNPTMFTTLPYLSKMLLAKDTLGRRLYATQQELASALGVSAVIACEALEATTGLIGIIVNLADYTIGADKGGEVSMFDFFDIDYNQFKYLMETRVSGAMTKYKGAITVTEFTGSGTLLDDPTAPTFDSVSGIVTIPTVSHVSYVDVADDGTLGSALSSGAQTAIAIGDSVHIRALAASTYAFSDGADDDWIFTRTG
jgi:HK97 family phage prohead protease